MFQNGIGAKLASPSTKEWVVRISTGFRAKTLVNCGNPEVAEATGNCGRWGTLPGFWAEALGAKPHVEPKATNRPVFGVSKFFLLTQSTLVV